MTKRACTICLAKELSSEGYEILHAMGGREGLKLAKEARPDLITLDIIMPDLDGWSVLRAIKDDPELRDTPVVLVTIMGDRDLGFALGAADFITKPFERERLVRAVNRHRRGDGAAKVLVVDDDAKTRGRAAAHAARGRLDGRRRRPMAARRSSSWSAGDRHSSSWT